MVYAHQSTMGQKAQLSSFFKWFIFVLTVPFCIFTLQLCQFPFSRTSVSVSSHFNLVFLQFNFDFLRNSLLTVCSSIMILTVQLQFLFRSLVATYDSD